MPVDDYELLVLFFADTKLPDARAKSEKQGNVSKKIDLIFVFYGDNSIKFFYFLLRSH